MLIPQKRRLIATFTVAVLLVQVLVPRGHMPASLASGWFLKLCPDGLSPVAMMALYGDHHHHKHGDHHEHGHHQEPGAHATADETRPCELAGLFVDVVQAGSPDLGLSWLSPSGDFGANPSAPRVSLTRLFRARAPPFA